MTSLGLLRGPSWGPHSGPSEPALGAPQNPQRAPVLPRWASQKRPKGIKTKTCEEGLLRDLVLNYIKPFLEPSSGPPKRHGGPKSRKGRERNGETREANEGRGRHLADLPRPERGESAARSRRRGLTKMPALFPPPAGRAQFPPARGERQARTAPLRTPLARAPGAPKHYEKGCIETELKVIMFVIMLP